MSIIEYFKIVKDIKFIEENKVVGTVDLAAMNEILNWVSPSSCSSDGRVWVGNKILFDFNYEKNSI